MLFICRIMEISNSQSSALSDGELNAILNDAVPVSTKKSTMWGVRKFTDWLSKRRMTCDFHTIEAAELADMLRKFYGELQPKQGVR